MDQCSLTIHRKKTQPKSGQMDLEEDYRTPDVRLSVMLCNNKCKINEEKAAEHE